MKNIPAWLAVVLLLTAATPSQIGKNYSDNEIRRILVKESIHRYPGKCPCPYSKKEDGSVCGEASAYKGAGEGYGVLCYETDVTTEMVQRYRKAYLQKYQAPKDIHSRPGKRPQKKAFFEDF